MANTTAALSNDINAPSFQPLSSSSRSSQPQSLDFKSELMHFANNLQQSGAHYEVESGKTLLGKGDETQLATALTELETNLKAVTAVLETALRGFKEIFHTQLG